jgi:hypothetical protein
MRGENMTRLKSRACDFGHRSSQILSSSLIHSHFFYDDKKMIRSRELVNGSML